MTDQQRIRKLETALFNILPENKPSSDTIGTARNTLGSRYHELDRSAMNWRKNPAGRGITGDRIILMGRCLGTTVIVTLSVVSGCLFILHQSSEQAMWTGAGALLGGLISVPLLHVWKGRSK